MLRIKSNFRSSQSLRITYSALVLLLTGLYTAAGLCAEVPLATARRVAEQKLRHHVALYGSWNGYADPVIAESQPVRYDDQVVAYNFIVEPSGHILVAVDDAFSPIPLYSERSRFDPGNAYDPVAIESWIVPELNQRVGALKRYRRSLALQRREPLNSRSRQRTSIAWSYFTDPADQRVAELASRTAPGDPLLSSAWEQDSPYNLLTPEGSSCTNTLTGCVATAWAQVMRYHEWPEQGTGSHSYPMNNSIISADFNVTYDWINMPNEVENGSSAAQKNAVAQLMFHAGVAAEMEYGCTASGSSAWASDVLDTYFKYKAMEFHQRSDYTPEQWFQLFKDEIDAERPVIFSIFADEGGHEVVVHGYQEGVDADKLFINFGWGTGSYDGFYDVTDDDDFNANFDWYIDNQFAVTKIEPNGDPRPTVNAGEEQTVDEGDSVTLSGTVVDAVQRYEWRQVGVGDSGLDVTIRNSDTVDQATFTAPGVSQDTDLVFMLKATNANRSVGFDKVTVRVRDTGAPDNDDGGGGGGGSSRSGGCFITSLH